jgi:hypothetical protein
MTIYGVSQSSGVEKRLQIEKGIEGVILTIADHLGRKEQGRISVLADSLVAAITAHPARGSTVAGLPSPNGTKMRMDVEVRRNEVWLKMTSDSGDGADIAVGFDDLQDALEGVISMG